MFGVIALLVWTSYLGLHWALLLGLVAPTFGSMVSFLWFLAFALGSWGILLPERKEEKRGSNGRGK